MTRGAVRCGWSKAEDEARECAPDYQRLARQEAVLVPFNLYCIHIAHSLQVQVSYLFKMVGSLSQDL